MPLNTADIYIVLFFLRVRKYNIFTFLWGFILSGVMKSNVKLKVKLFKQAGIHTVYASQSNYLYIKNIELH